jgi:hypothetical protein
MTRTLLAPALAALFMAAPAPADDKPAKDKLLGKWALPGKTKERWEIHPDGTITGTADGKPVFHPAASAGPHLTYTVGATDEEGNVEVTFTVRVADKGEGVYKAKVEFTRQGRFTMRYTQQPRNAGRFPLPFPDGRKLYRPEDVTD